MCWKDTESEKGKVVLRIGSHREHGGGKGLGCGMLSLLQCGLGFNQWMVNLDSEPLGSPASSLLSGRPDLGVPPLLGAGTSVDLPSPGNGQWSCLCSRMGVTGVFSSQGSMRKFI